MPDTPTLGFCDTCGVPPGSPHVRWMHTPELREMGHEESRGGKPRQRDKAEDWRTRAMEAEAEVARLRQVFEAMASEDWRGNKPQHITIAERALNPDA